MKKGVLKTAKIGTKLWILLEQYNDVPAGFITDGASVPKLFHNILAPMTGAHVEACVEHDYDFSLDRANDLRNFSTVNKIWLQRMLLAGTKFWRAKGAYYAVKFFGKSSYKVAYSKEKLRFAYEQYKRKTPEQILEMIGE